MCVNHLVPNLRLIGYSDIICFLDIRSIIFGLSLAIEKFEYMFASEKSFHNFLVGHYDFIPESDNRKRGEVLHFEKVTGP